METKEKKDIVVQTTVNASIEAVWKYFTEAEHIMKWYNASDDWHAPYADNDMQVGRKFKTTMAAKDGSAGFNFEGVYTNIRTHELIEYAIADGRKVSVEFSSEGDQTRVVETFEAENVYSHEMQKTGWQSILDNFKKYVESREK